MDDLISRQAAIDAIEAEKTKRGDYLTSSYVGYEIAEKVVAELPPAQPATNCSEFPNSSDDTISRQAAIDVVEEMQTPIMRTT